MGMKITNVSHVRELTELEYQAVDMTIGESIESDLSGEESLTFTLGEQTVSGKTTPFISISRKGNPREVTILFRDKDRTADERRKSENSRQSATTGTVRKPPAKPKLSTLTKGGNKK